MTDSQPQPTKSKRQRSPEDIAIQALKVAVRERKALDARVTRLEADLDATKTKREFAKNTEKTARTACK